MDLQIQIDYRETALCAELDKLGIEYTRNNLVVGDIGYFDGNTPVFFCERKTYDDLNASIISGRYRDQRARLLESKVPFVFIIEGPNRPRVPQNSARTLGALENLAIIHKVGVIPTISTAQTALCVSHLRTKLAERPQAQTHIEPDDTSRSGKLVHRKTRIMQRVFANQLTCISGVSEHTAKAIELVYPTMSALMSAYASKESESEKQTLLENVQVARRRLGPTLSRRIYRAHHGYTSD